MIAISTEDYFHNMAISRDDHKTNIQKKDYVCNEFKKFVKKTAVN
jgi:hypothetical protein